MCYRIAWMPSHVRISHAAGSGGGDSRAAGLGRLKLKLGAVAYACTRHGIDADQHLARAGRADLIEAAFDYVEAVTGAPSNRRRIDPDDLRAARLQSAAIAYATIRHGVDGEQGLIRAGMALLCARAISYVELVTGADPSRRPVDPDLHIGNGT
jgi:hypothetical protein